MMASMLPTLQEQLSGINTLPLPDDVEIARIDDEYGSIQVYDRGDERYLTFDSPHQQSGIYKSDPARLLHHYTQAMMLVLLYRQPRHITLLGLGGGALAHSLYKHCPEVQLQAVELREAVIESAYRFFKLPNDPRLKVAHMDAGAYLALAEDTSTDIIFADLHWSYEIDQYQLNTAFIGACQRVLIADGWLVLNYFCDDVDKITGLKALYELFPVIKTCATGAGNLVVLAGKRKPGKTRAVLLQEAEALGKTLRVPMLGHAKRLEGATLYDPAKPLHENI
jgi:spermidine synthase